MNCGRSLVITGKSGMRSKELERTYVGVIKLPRLLVESSTVDKSQFEIIPCRHVCFSRALAMFSGLASRASSQYPANRFEKRGQSINPAKPVNSDKAQAPGRAQA